MNDKNDEDGEKQNGKEEGREQEMKIDENRRVLRTMRR